MSRKLSPASVSTSSIRLSDDSAVTICSSRTPSRKRLQFLPNSKRSPRATSSACQGASSLLRASSIFLLRKSVRSPAFRRRRPASRNGSASNASASRRDYELLLNESLAQYAPFHLFRNGQSHQRQERRRYVQVIGLGE